MSESTVLFDLPIDWSGIGALVTATAAIVALVVASKELQANRAASADDIYRDFLSSSLKYPAFIYPDHKLVDPKKQLFAGNPQQFWHYEVYVDLMLTAFEQMFDLSGFDLSGDDRFKKYIGGYLYSHDKYLSSTYFEENFVQEMDPAFWAFAKRALADEKAKWESEDR